MAEADLSPTLLLLRGLRDAGSLDGYSRKVIFRAPMPDADAAIAAGRVHIADPSGRRLERFGEVPEGSFVWTRDGDGMYRLGRIAGPLRGEVRAVEWLVRPFGEDEVPTAVAATFARGGRNFQRTHSERAERETEGLWCDCSPGTSPAG